VWLVKVDEFQAGRHLTTHSTGARISLPFIVNLSVMAWCARPVNSGVRQLSSMTRFALIMIVVASGFGTAVGQREPHRATVLLNASKPGVYISFLRVGKIEPLETGVSDTYLWFRFTNNTRWGVWFKMSGVPNAAYGDGRFYFTIIESDGGKIRIDNRCHVCSVNPVAPGRSVVFSIPSNYATRHTFLRMTYSFAWERDKEDEDGSSSTHAVEFYFYHLPKDALSY
jgi:hypothetical protein